MKKRVVFLCLSLGLSFGPNAGAGGDSMGNGGDRVSGEFAGIAQDFVNTLERTDLSGDLISKVEALKISLREVKFNSRDTLTLNGLDVDAINYPKAKSIMVARLRWDKNPDHHSDSTKRLVIHEYLEVSGFDDSTYLISENLVHLFNLETLKEFAFIKAPLIKLKGEISRAIKNFDQTNTGRQGAVEAKTNFCVTIWEIDRLIDNASLVLSTNQSKLEESGILNLSKSIDQFVQLRVYLGKHCDDPTSNPLSTRDYLVQIELVADDLLNLF